MDPIKRDRKLKKVATAFGLASTGLATFIIALLLVPPAATVSAIPIGHTDPPYVPPPNPCMHTESTNLCSPPPPHDPYCLFPGQGKHLGFGNGHGRAGARFLCYGAIYDLFFGLF